MARASCELIERGGDYWIEVIIAGENGIGRIGPFDTKREARAAFADLISEAKQLGAHIIPRLQLQ